MKRVQPSLAAKRPAIRRLPAANTMAASRRSVPIDRARASRLAIPSRRSDGLSRSPARVRSGSTIQPVSRSITTEAKTEVHGTVEELVRRLTRRTSPPIVEGRKFPTNWPAR
jgi:hypothetical protein